jgi:hypothetical protein
MCINDTTSHQGDAPKKETTQPRRRRLIRRLALGFAPVLEAGKKRQDNASKRCHAGLDNRTFWTDIFRLSRYILVATNGCQSQYLRTKHTFRITIEIQGFDEDNPYNSENTLLPNKVS